MGYCWTLIFSILGGAIGLWYFLSRNVNYFKTRGIPYIEGIPLLGNMWPIVFRKLSFAEHIQKLYNSQPDAKYVGILNFMEPVFMIRDPELIKSVTIKNFDNFHDHRNIMDDGIDPLFAKNLLFLQGERWRDMRSLLSPSFTFSRMKMMFKLVSQCGLDLSNYLTAKASLPIEMEMKDTFTRYTNDVIATSAFGISVNSLKDRDNEFYTMGRKATNFRGIRSAKLFIMNMSPFLAKLFDIKFIENDINKFFSHIIGSTVATRDEKGIVRNDMLQLMMQARDRGDKTNLTIEDMTAQALIFFFGGFETSSTLMCFAAYEVGINPDIQERLQAEIDAVLAEDQDELTYESLIGMKYLDAVINETLRLYPPFCIMDRACTKAFELPPAAPDHAPITVEVGTNVWLPCHGIHRDPQYFSDPDKFDPERFSDENKGSIPSIAYFPFGFGPRSCIGNRFALMEAKLAIFHLFAKCNLSPCSKTSIPIKFDKQNMNTSSENDFWLTIQQRS